MKRAVVLLTLGGCLEVPGPSCPEHGDADHDGWECFGELGDCDDGDATRNPGLVEVCGDGIDQDCTGDDQPCPMLEGVALSGETGNRWQVATSTTQVQLDSEDWVVSSLRLRDDSAELLYLGTNPERMLGVAVYPLFHRADADATPPVIVTRGPARVELEVAWTSDAFGEGVTTLGFSPDGRIARRERISPLAQSSGGGDPLYFATFASFDLTRFSHLDYTANPDGPIAFPDLQTNGAYNGTSTDTGWVCLSDEASGRRIAMAWANQPAAAGPRMTRGTDGHFGFEYDWDRAAPSILASDVQSVTLLAPSVLTDDPAAPCAELDPDVFADPAPLLFTTGGAGIDDPDGDGFVVEEHVYEVANTGGDDHVEVELGDGALDGGFTLRVIMEAPDGVTVWRDAERLIAGVDFLTQPLPPPVAGVLLYFPPGFLARGDRLWIAQPGGEP